MQAATFVASTNEIRELSADEIDMVAGGTISASHVAAGALSGAATGARIGGSVGGGVGAAVGAAVGAVVGAIASLFD
jgi:outer membrane lipoprotein SlyB